MGDKLADVVDALGCSQVLEHLEAVQGKLVVEQPVAEEHGEADAEDVAELAEAEPEVVLGVLGPEVKEVLGNLGGLLGGVSLVALVAALHLHVLRLALQDVVDQPVLKKPLPGRPGNKKSNLDERRMGWSCVCSPWQSCQDKANSEKIRKPEVISSDWRVLLRLDLGLVNKAACSCALERLSHVARPVNPTIRLGVLRQRFVTMAQNGLLGQVQVVLFGNHNKPNHYYQCGRLKIGTVFTLLY